jgi:hypothetical protein
MKPDAIIAGWIILAIIVVVAALMIKYRKLIHWGGSPSGRLDQPSWMPGSNADGTPIPAGSGFDVNGKPAGFSHWLGR